MPCKWDLSSSLSSFIWGTSSNSERTNNQWRRNMYPRNNVTDRICRISHVFRCCLALRCCLGIGRDSIRQRKNLLKKKCSRSSAYTSHTQRSVDSEREPNLSRMNSVYDRMRATEAINQPNKIAIEEVAWAAVFPISIGTDWDCTRVQAELHSLMLHFVEIGIYG